MRRWLGGQRSAASDVRQEPQSTIPEQLEQVIRILVKDDLVATLPYEPTTQKDVGAEFSRR